MSTLCDLVRERQDVIDKKTDPILEQFRVRLRQINNGMLARREVWAPKVVVEILYDLQTPKVVVENVLINGRFALAMAPKVVVENMLIGRGMGCIWVYAYIS